MLLNEGGCMVGHLDDESMAYVVLFALRWS